MIYNYENNMKTYQPETDFNPFNFNRDFKAAYARALKGNEYGANMLLGRYHAIPVVPMVYDTLSSISKIARNKEAVVNTLSGNEQKDAVRNYKDWYKTTRTRLSALRAKIVENQTAIESARTYNT
jgi:hypothetical protein